MSKRKKPRIVRRDLSPAVVPVPSAASAPSSSPGLQAQRSHRGNGSAGDAVVIGVKPTEKYMAAMAGEFPTPTPELQKLGGKRPPSNARQPRSLLFSEVGYADPYRLFPSLKSDPQYAYNPNILVSRKGYFTIDEMRRDEQVKAALTFKKQAVIAAGWKVDPPEGKEDDDEATEFVRANLQKMEGSLERTLLEVMTALDYGFSVTERVYEEKDGKIWLKALKVRRPHTFEFAQDAFGNVLGLRQQQRELPIEKFVLYSYDYEFSNPYGTSDLTACYRAWWTKRNAYQWMAMLLERLGVPPIFLLYNPNDYPAQQRQDLITILKNMQAATTGVIPRPNADSAEFWSPELAGQVSSVFIPSMDKFDKDISRGLLMPGLMGMTADDQVGSMARSKVHFDVFMLVLERIRAEIQERVIQEQVIEPLYALNFGEPTEDTVPRFGFLPITDELRAEVLTAWQGLVAGGIVTPTDEDERHIRQLVEFPEFDEDQAAERQQRIADAEMENTKAKIDAGLMPDPTEKPAPFGGAGGGKKPAFGKKPANDEDDDEEAQKKMSLTDEQFEQVLDDLRRAAEETT